MVSSTLWKNSIGGSIGSAPIKTTSIALGEGNINAQEHDERRGRQASEPVRKVLKGYGPAGELNAGPGASAKGTPVRQPKGSGRVV